jgi:hypothetical protein
MSTGHPVDAEPHRADRTARLHRVEGEVRRQGPTLLLAAQRLPAQHPRASRRNSPPLHLHGMPQQLSLDSRPHWRRIFIQEINYRFFVLLLFLFHCCNHNKQKISFVHANLQILSVQFGSAQHHDMMMYYNTKTICNC